MSLMALKALFLSSYFSFTASSLSEISLIPAWRSSITNEILAMSFCAISIIFKSGWFFTSKSSSIFLSLTEIASIAALNPLSNNPCKNSGVSICLSLALRIFSFFPLINMSVRVESLRIACCSAKLYFVFERALVAATSLFVSAIDS